MKDKIQDILDRIEVESDALREKVDSQQQKINVAEEHIQKCAKMQAALVDIVNPLALDYMNNVSFSKREMANLRKITQEATDLLITMEKYMYELSEQGVSPNE